MAAAEAQVGSSAAIKEGVSPPPPSISHGRSRFSIHLVLGGGAVADVILWRRRNATLLLFAGATAAWYLFEIAGYSFLSLLANALLLLVTILFFWARSASLLNRPLPPLPNLEISDRTAEKVADEVRPSINRALSVARGIALEGDRKLFLQVILCLWAVSYIGSLFSFFTLVYLGVVFSLTFPALYDKYQDHIDKRVTLVHNVLMDQYENILIKTGRSVKKEKKTE